MNPRCMLTLSLQIANIKAKQAKAEKMMKALTADVKDHGDKHVAVKMGGMLDQMSLA